MKTMLLSFVDGNDRDVFLSTISGYVETLAGVNPAASEVLREALGSVRFDPSIKTDAERIAAVHVAGVKVKEGMLSEAEKSFAYECDATRSTIELKELKDGQWVTIRQRKKQLM